MDPRVARLMAMQNEPVGDEAITSARATILNDVKSLLEGAPLLSDYGGG